MPRILGLGDNSMDYYLQQAKKFPGGNALNVAVYAARVNQLASYLGWVGKDADGQIILNTLQAEGIDTSHCRVATGTTARSEISLIDGERSFENSDDGVGSLLHLEDDDFQYIAQHDLVHTSAYSYVESFLPKLATTASMLTFDFTHEWTKDYLATHLPFVDMAFLSAPTLTDEDATALLKWCHAFGPSHIVVTRGAKGAVAYNGERCFHQGVIETDVVDTLGAGDAFIAHFIVQILHGTVIPEALHIAATKAAGVCSYLGALGRGIPLDTGGDSAQSRSR